MAVANIKRALRPESYKMIGAESMKRPMWRRDHLVNMLALLNDQPFVLEETARRFFGDTRLDSMIRHNLIYPRPTPKYTNDIPNCSSEPIIVAPSPLQLTAMREVLATLN